MQGSPWTSKPDYVNSNLAIARHWVPAAAKANYFALAGDPSALSAAVNRAKARWQQLDSRKQTVVAEMSEPEELEHDLIAD